MLRTIDISESLKLLESLPTGLALRAMDGAIVYANASLAAMLGYEAERLVELGYWRLISEACHGRERAVLERLRHSGHCEPYESEYVRRDGSHMPVRISANVVEIGGEPRICSHVDTVTDIRAYEIALSSSEERFRTLYESAMDGLLLLSLEGRIININEVGHARLGYGKDEMLGRNISEFVSPELASVVLDRFQQVIVNGQASFESAHVAKDGRIMPVEVNARLLPMNGMSLCFGIVRDISERKEMIDRVRERDAMFRAVFETSLDGFWVLDMAGRILEVNDAYTQLSGYSREELLGMRISDVEAEEDAGAVVEHIGRLMRKGHDRFESVHRKKDGRIWPVEIVTSYWDIGGGRIFGFIIDITERRQQLESIHHAKELAEAANAEKTRFLAAASHDLRQPLHAMNLYLDAIFHEGDEGSRQDLLHKLRYASDALGSLLNSLLDISCLDAGTVTPQAAVIELESIMHELMAEFGPQAEAKHLRLRLRHGCARVYSDPVLLKCILRNLLSNAVRYTQGGGVLLGCRRAGDKLRIGVWDTGPGIPEHELDRIFMEFYQLHNAERNRENGLGLGLGIVRRLSALLDHPVRVRSRLGRGSYFSVDVPLCPTHVADALGESSSPWDAGVLAGRFVAVVDDESSILDAMRTWLRQVDCEVLSAESGEALLHELELYAYPMPDALIVDFRLQEHQTGLDVVQDVEAYFGKTVPALVISGDADIAEDIRQEGCRFLAKPAGEDEILRELLALIDGPPGFPDRESPGP